MTAQPLLYRYTPINEIDDKGYCQESIDKEVLGVVLDSWREWVQSGRPDRKEIYSTETHFGFDPSCPLGGFDEDGAPYGPHHWYSPKMSGYYWSVCRELLRHQHLAMYWFHLIHVPANNAAPLTQQRAFEDDFSA